jgi:hypothetical protein
MIMLGELVGYAVFQEQIWNYGHAQAINLCVETATQLSDPERGPENI